jgi:hypothetical protein
MLIATAQATSSAAPTRFFERWADMATWPEWNLVLGTGMRRSAQADLDRLVRVAEAAEPAK